jgi:hypothetical protein
LAYDLIARLGRGGMGVVDLARDADGKKVALKRLTLQGSAADIARARQRLLREAEVLRRLHHPNVVGLLDVVDEGDEIVLVMPYLSGGSLSERVAQHGPAPADEVERQALRLLGALASAHRAGIVHRDIKPANVLFDERGEPCLADFGVALSRDQTHGLTVAGMVVGTPGFMAPEQARGEPVSPATDVFSLGATLLFAATGDGPYGQGDPGLLMVRAAGGKIEKVPRNLPKTLRTLIVAMLDPRPERRPTAASLAGGPEGTVARTQELRRVRFRQRWWAAIAVGLAAIGLLAAAAWLVTRDGGGDPGRGPLPGDGAAADEGACTDLPYQPCGQAAPAPGTDGRQCLADRADYDGDVANGCEVVGDDVDGDALVDTIEANIAPADDVDSYPVTVKDNIQFFCDGHLAIRLEAPPNIVLGLEVRDDDELLGRGTAIAGAPATVELGEARCGADDATTLEVTVRPLTGDRTGENYRLSRDGDF